MKQSRRIIINLNEKFFYTDNDEVSYVFTLCILGHFFLIFDAS